MKLRITQPGYHDQDGKPVKIGTILSVKGSMIPASLLNKCEVTGDIDSEKTVVTNPADPGAQQKTPRRKGLETQAGKLEVAFSDDMSDEDLQAAIKAKKTGT